MTFPKTCPYCGKEVPGDDPWAEIDHMTADHPDIVRERLKNIGEIPPDETSSTGQTTEADQRGSGEAG